MRIAQYRFLPRAAPPPSPKIFRYIIGSTRTPGLEIFSHPCHLNINDNSIILDKWISVNGINCAFIPQHAQITGCEKISSFGICAWVIGCVPLCLDRVS
jgi:hypothetical protein